MGFNFSNSIQTADSISSVDLRAQVLMVNKALAELHNSLHSKADNKKRDFMDKVNRIVSLDNQAIPSFITYNEETSRIEYNPDLINSVLYSNDYIMYLLYKVDSSYNSCVEALLPYFKEDPTYPKYSFSPVNDYVHESYIVKRLDNSLAHYIDFGALEFALRLLYSQYHSAYESTAYPSVTISVFTENFATPEQRETIVKHWIADCPAFIRKNKDILKQFTFTEHTWKFLFDSLGINPYSDPFYKNEFKQADLYTQLVAVTKRVWYLQITDDF